MNSFDVSPTTVLIKSEAQRELTQREAYAGDNEAARRMGDYYYAKKDRATCIWWYELAARRGDPVAKESLKKLLQELQ